MEATAELESVETEKTEFLGAVAEESARTEGDGSFTNTSAEELSTDKPDQPGQQADETPTPVVEESAKEPTAADKQPESRISDGFIKTAEDLGMPATVARSFETEEALVLFLAPLAEAADAKKAAAEPAKPEPAPEAPKDEPVETQTPSPLGEAKFDLDDLDESDPIVAIGNTVKALHQHVTSQMQPQLAQLSEMRTAMKEMAETMQQVVAQHESQQSAQFVERFDSWVERQEGYEDILGKGPTLEMKDGSKERTARDELIKKARGLDKAFTQLGEPFKDLDSLLLAARRIQFGDHEEQAQRNRVNQQVRDAQGRFTSPPSSDNGSLPVQDEWEQARVAAREVARRHGRV